MPAAGGDGVSSKRVSVRARLNRGGERAVDPSAKGGTLQ
jgi:hypothetical protein